MRRGLTLVVAGVVVVCLMAAVVVLTRSDSTPSTPKAPVRGSVVEWNMSGFSQNRGGIAPAERLVQEVTKRSPLPIAVVTVETCSSQYDYLRQKLTAAPFGYAATASWSIPRFGRPDCASFGNTIFWLGDSPPGGVTTVTYPDATQADGPATQEKRNLICVAFTIRETDTTAATPVRICGTHLARDQTVSAKQLVVARTLVAEQNRAGPPTFLVGDLNTLPAAPVLDPLYATGQFAEADGGPRAQARATTTGKFPFKYDYGFVPGNAVDVAGPAEIVPVPEFSDHSIFVIHFAFRPAGA